MLKDIVHTRIVSTLLIVTCIVVSAGMAGFFLDLFETAEGAVNTAPTADAGTGPLGGFTSVSMSFNGNESMDDDGEIVSYDWDFGDGFAGIGVKPSHTYYDSGEYLAMLTVTDNDGAKDTDTIEVSISDDPEGMYQLVTVNELFVNGTQYFETLVKVVNAMVTDDGSYGSGYGSDPSGWVKFEISDTTTSDSIECYVEGGATRPLELRYGDLLQIYSMLDKYSGQWELHVRVDTPDKVELMPAVYTNYTLAELLSDREAHSNEYVRCTELEVLTHTTYGWMVTDDTTTEEIQVYPQPGAVTPAYVNVSDRIMAQGIFTFYDYNQDKQASDDEWEIKVRAAAEDKVERTYEFDYPPIIANVQHDPAVPSPYAPANISATITDNTGIASATLRYAYDGAAQTAVAMTRWATTNTYLGDIPASATGTNVSYYIVVTDIVGQEVISDTYSYIITDSPPVISDILQEPEWVRPTDAVVISASVYEDSGIVAVNLTYTNDSWVSWFNITMLDDGLGDDVAAGDGIYTCSMGTFPEATTVNYFVNATDGIGQSDVSIDYEFVSSFDQPPQFRGVFRSNELPSSSDTVKIIADVTDDLKMENVTLYYDADTGAGFVQVNMTLGPDGYYEASIPAQAALTVVDYYVNASDNGSHVQKFPAGEPYRYIVDYNVPSVLCTTGHGEYTGMDDFSDLVRDMGYTWLEADINDVALEWVEFIIISDPEEQYTAAEMTMLYNFVNNGGGLLLMCETDWSDYGNPENCNPILENLSISGRFNDDGYQDAWYFFDYPSFSEPGGTIGDASYHLPYFNFLHRGVNGSYNPGDYDDWGCFDLDDTEITSGFVENKSWMKGWSMSTLVSVGSDTVVIQGSDHGFNADSTVGEPYTQYLEGSRPPILAAHTGLGTGRVLYGGIASMVSNANWAGWEHSNVTTFVEHCIDWLVNTPLLPAPSIDNVVQTPIDVTSSDDVTIDCSVTDVGPAISKVTLHYSVNGSLYQTMDMTDLGGGAYTADIPTYASGSVITYYIEAVDASDNFGFYPKVPGETGIGWYAIQGGVVDHIVISEVAYNPRGNDPDYEFVELYNPFPAPLSLEGWSIGKQKAANNVTDRTSAFPTGSMIPAYGYFLVSGYKLDAVLEIDAYLNFEFDMVNSDGLGLKLYDARDVIIDRVAYVFDENDIPIYDSTMWEDYPYIPPDPDDGSFERLPTVNSIEGNYIDTDNNSADFEFRYSEEPRASWCPPEYPPWADTVTSPFPLPDDHPSKLASVPSSEILLSEPEPVDTFEASPPFEPDIYSEPPVVEDVGRISVGGLLFAPMMIIPSAIVIVSGRRWK